MPIRRKFLEKFGSINTSSSFFTSCCVTGCSAGKAANTPVGTSILTMLSTASSNWLSFIEAKLTPATKNRLKAISIRCGQVRRKRSFGEEGT